MPTGAANWSFRDFIERAPAGIAMFDNEMRYIAVSSRFLTDNRLNESQRSVMGRSIYEIAPDLLDHWREIHLRVLAGETISAQEEVYPHPDGTRDWVSWEMEPWWHPSGTVGGAVLFTDVVTERKEAEIALAASESLLRLSQQAGRIGSYEWDLASNKFYWSDYQCHQFGIEPTGRKPVPFETWRRIVDPEDLPKVEENLRLLIQIGDYTENEYRIHGPNGTRWLHSRVQAIRDQSGAALKLIGIDMDVTERRILQDRLRELNETLENRVEKEIAAREQAQLQLSQAQKMQSIGELTGGVAHDFNNLLTVITGSIDILADAVADRPELERIVQSIGAAADRGAQLTANLLAFARKQPLRPQVVDVQALLHEVRGLLEPTLGRQIQIELIDACDVGSTLVDPVQLSSAIVNLGINARDAMPDGGRLTLGASRVVLYDSDAAPRELSPGNYIAIKVVDTGVGIPPSIQHKVFDPFFTTKEVGEGTGLGLSTIFGFVKQSGGHIEVRSVEQSGSIFTMYLPATESSPEPSFEVQSRAMITGSETILCVEDDPMVRDYVRLQLQRLGYNSIVAKDGNEALAIAEQGQVIDLLFTDIIMPGGVSGRQLVDQMRLKRPGIKILFTTGYSEDTSQRDHQNVLVLKKPYRLKELAEMIRRAFGR